MIWIRGESGALLSFGDGPLPPGIVDRLNSGQLLQVNEDGTPFDGDYEAEDELPEDVPPLPQASALRPVWEQFAVSQGMDEKEVRKLSKAQLIDRLSYVHAPSEEQVAEFEDLASTE